MVTGTNCLPINIHQRPGLEVDLFISGSHLGKVHVSVDQADGMDLWRKEDVRVTYNYIIYRFVIAL